jgi:hypothetical protein
MAVEERKHLLFGPNVHIAVVSHGIRYEIDNGERHGSGQADERRHKKSDRGSRSSLD